MAVLYTPGNYKCVTRVTELTSPGTSSEASTTVQASVDDGFSETGWIGRRVRWTLWIQWTVPVGVRGVGNWWFPEKINSRIHDIRLHKNYFTTFVEYQYYILLKMTYVCLIAIWKHQVNIMKSATGEILWRTTELKNKQNGQVWQPNSSIYATTPPPPHIAYWGAIQSKYHITS